MSKVLIISPFPPPNDGIGEHSRNLATAWKELGHDVLIISPGRGSRAPLEVDSGLDVSRSIRVLSIRLARERVTKFQPDVVFCQFAISGFTTSLVSVIRLCALSQSLGAKVALAMHEASRELSLLGPLAPRVIRRATSKSDVIVTFSLGETKALSALNLGRKLVQVPLGNPDRLKPTDSERSKIAEKYSIVDTPTVLSIGFIHADKGVDRLLESAPFVTKQIPRAKFLVAGEPRRRRGVFRPLGVRDARHLRSLKSRALALRDVTDIDFVGFVSQRDLLPLMSAVTVVALPYRKITQSSIASFACAANTPVVATDVAGFREAFGAGAQYVNPDDAEAFGSVLIDVLENESLRSSMKHELREKSSRDSMTEVARVIVESTMEK